MIRKKTEIIDLKSIAKKMPNYLDNEVVPTNGYVLNSLLKPGIDLSSTIQIVGESGTGKSTIALLIAKSFCTQSKNVVYLDTHNSISKEMIKSIGLEKFMEGETQRFYYLRLSTFSEVEKQLDQFIKTDEISLVVIDSLAGLLNAGFTNLEKGLSINESASSYNSRPLGMLISKYKVLAEQKKFAIVFTNQYRNQINMKGNTGTKLKEYGVKNVSYNSDVIIKIGVCREKDFINISNAYRNVNRNGIAESFELVKSNKSEPKEYPFYLAYGKDISNLCNYIYALMKLEIIKQNGTYYLISFQGTEIKENGMENFIRKISELRLDLYAIYQKEIDEFYKN